MFKKIIRTGLFFIALSVVANPLYAEKKPLWELGVGLAVFHNPHYLGADQEQTYVLPTPYLNYRGEMFRADRSGIRGFLYSSEKINFGISAGGSLPVNSDDSDARDGMDDLDTQFELGPVFEYQLFKNDNHLVRFDLPVRGAFLLGDEFLRHRGWTSNPRLYYETDIDKWQINADAGLVWSDQRYHAYIYDVDSDDVTVDRPFYQSKSGLTASRFNIGVKRKLGDYYLGFKLRYYNLNNAENNDSPLVKREDYWSASLVVAWIFDRSEKMVDAN